MSFLDTPQASGIRSESTPKSILKKSNRASRSKVLFSPTKEVKNFKDYFDTTDEDARDDSIPTDLIRRRKNTESVAPDEVRIEDIGSIKEDKLIHRILTDSNIPYVLSLYLQLLFNLVIVSLICYFLIIFITTIRTDINNKLELYITDSLQEISKCSRDFYRNKCNEEKVPPILEGQCTNWLKCMNRDPQLIGKSMLTAETLADILNGFIKPISWKSIIFLLIIVFGSVVITNVAFNTYRHSTNVKLDQLEMTIRRQNKYIERLQYHKDESADDLSISSPLVKKSYP